ncbi:MazG-related protein [Vibrio diabolicus]|uniref:MazG-related protein n=1 Tax=Vibrio diabolicus TaxID=50719 RepID=UPI0012481EE0|nr:MazG-related protein [Vibrio diabolicus]KAB0317175.1 MazG-related protein [Vibrio diabolicus]
MSDRVKEALIWFKGILESERIDYQIVGGLAATIYGGSRVVADIDLYIHNGDAEKLLAKVGSYVSKPLTHYVEYGWDLEYFQLIYHSQKIEVGLSKGTRIQSALDGSWHRLEVNFSNSVSMCYQNVEVPVIPKDELIKYKRLLNREADLIDIQELTENPAP